MNEYLNLEEELVDYAEVSGFDISTGGYLKNVNLLNRNILEEEKGGIDLINIVKSVFIKLFGSNSAPEK